MQVIGNECDLGMIGRNCVGKEGARYENTTTLANEERLPIILNT